MTKLIIDNTVADLFDETIIVLNKQINDIFDLQDKRAGLSNTIKLPITPTNNGIFYNANDINSFDNTQRQFYDVKLIQNYEEIITRGRGRLINASSDSYEFIIYYGNIDLTLKLGDQTINDLDLDAYDEMWDYTNLYDGESIANMAYNWVIFPIQSSVKDADLPEGIYADPIELCNMLPFFSVSRLLRELFDQNDITPLGDIIDDYQLDIDAEVDFSVNKDLFIPLIDRNPKTSEGVDIISTNTETLYTININVFGGGSGTINNTLSITDISDDNNTFTNYFTATDLKTYEIKLDFKLRIEKNTLTTNIPVSAYSVVIADLTINAFVWAETDNGTGTFVAFNVLGWLTGFGPPPIAYGLGSYAFDNLSINDLLSFNRLIDFEELTLNKQMVAGEKIRFKCFIQTSYSFYGIALVSNINLALNLNQDTNTLYNYTSTKVQIGELFPIAENLPSIKQIDLLKFICAYNGYIIDQTDGDNNLYFRKVQNIINDMPNAQDISHMIESYVIESIHSDMAQSNIMQYTNFENLPENLANGIIDIADETLEVKNTIYTAPFSATENFMWRDNIPVIDIPILNDPDGDDADSVNDIKPRVCKVYRHDFYYDPPSTDERVFITDGSTIYNFTKKYVASFELSQRWNSRIASVYPEYSEMMNDFKHVKAIANMTANEFKTIDLKLPAFISQLGAYFIINKISDYVDGKKVIIDLIKI